jgi:peptidoglycan/xylan/chitin deacetylase (PgdA/CDA1 family)
MAGTVFLMYHELELPGRALCRVEQGYVRYVLREDEFGRQMEWLKEAGFEGASVGDSISSPAPKRLALTFDDGCETDLITAAPILKRQGFHATFYLTVEFLNKPGYLSFAQVQELAHLGFEIGCHSMSHAYLDELDSQGVHREIAEARDRLQQISGTLVQHFSCPGGRYSKPAISVAREAGFTSFATSDRHANLSSGDRFLLGRIAILRDTEIGSFQSICRGQGLWKMRLSDSGRDIAKIVLGNAFYDRFRALLLGDSPPGA